MLGWHRTVATIEVVYPVSDKAVSSFPPATVEPEALKQIQNIARQLFTMADLERAMDGIEFRRSHVLLDEIPSGCKDIDEVMEHAKSVEIRHVLKQFLNVKGGHRPRPANSCEC
jgi:hypothetical protein